MEKITTARTARKRAVGKKQFAMMMVLAVVLLAGCAKNQGSTGGATGTGSGNSSCNVPEYQLAGTLKEGRENIYLIVKGINKSYFKVMFDAVKDAAEDLDCNVYYSGSESSSDWEVQELLMDIAAQNGATAIILAPDDTVKLADKVNELYARGISIIFVDAVVNTDSYDVCYMTDNFAAGQSAGEEMLEHLRDSGLSESESALIAIQAGRPSSQTINERLAGFCQYWEQNAPKAWHIIDDVKSNEGDDTKAYGVAEEYFAEYTGIKGVFGTNNGATRGFANYLSTNGLSDVAIVGFDYSKEIAALIEDGSYRASTMLQQQYDMAYRGVQAALEIKAGTFSNDGKLVDTGVIAVNHGNIMRAEVQEVISRN